MSLKSSLTEALGSMSAAEIQAEYWMAESSNAEIKEINHDTNGSVKDIEKHIENLFNEGYGAIRIARILNLSPTFVLSRIQLGYMNLDKNRELKSLRTSIEIDTDIQELYNMGYGQRRIAKLLGVSFSLVNSRLINGHIIINKDRKKVPLYDESLTKKIVQKYNDGFLPLEIAAALKTTRGKVDYALRLSAADVVSKEQHEENRKELKKLGLLNHTFVSRGVATKGARKGTRNGQD